MVSSKEIEKQIKRLNVHFSFFGNAELRELQNIIVENEQIEYCTNGRYSGGFAVLCVTNMRVLLIDKKPFFLMLEDHSYEMITGVDYSYRLLDATVKIRTANKTLKFTGFNKQALRDASSQIQQQVIHFRQLHIMRAESEQSGIAQVIDNTPTREWPQPNNFSPAILSGTSDEAGLVEVGLPDVGISNSANHYIKSPLLTRRRLPRY